MFFSGKWSLAAVFLAIFHFPNKNPSRGWNKQQRWISFKRLIVVCLFSMVFVISVKVKIIMMIIINFNCFDLFVLFQKQKKFHGNLQTNHQLLMMMIINWTIIYYLRFSKKNIDKWNSGKKQNKVNYIHVCVMAICTNEWYPKNQHTQSLVNQSFAVFRCLFVSLSLCS